MYIKLADGLVHPFLTTVGVKQGCVFSPILFNLFINKICTSFDQSCDPVQLNNVDVNCLLWADDLLLISKTPTGLQNSIDKMHQFYTSLGLDVNIKKTKVMIMNKRGRKLENSQTFKLNGQKLEITDEYQYIVKSKFDVHFLDKINEVKFSNLDTNDHNKLRTYKTLKSSFTREPYIDLIRNRNQRCFLSRLRASSHTLRIELGRYTRPITPVDQRTCQYCCLGPPTRPPPPGSPTQAPPAPPAAPPDTELHFLVQCTMFTAERNCLFKKIECLNPSFAALSLNDKFKILLCPTSAVCTKLINKFIKNMFKSREKFDEIRSASTLGCTNPSY